MRSLFHLCAGQSGALYFLLSLILCLFKKPILRSFVLPGKLVDLIADIGGQRLANFLADFVADLFTHLFPDFLGQAFQKAVEQRSTDDQHNFHTGKAFLVRRCEVANVSSDFGSDLQASGLKGWIHVDLQKLEHFTFGDYRFTLYIERAD